MFRTFNVLAHVLVAGKSIPYVALQPHDNWVVKAEAAEHVAHPHFPVFAFGDTVFIVCLRAPPVRRAPLSISFEARFASTNPVSWSFNFLLLSPSPLQPPPSPPLHLLISTPRLLLLVFQIFRSSHQAWKDKWKTLTASLIRIKDNY